MVTLFGLKGCVPSSPGHASVSNEVPETRATFAAPLAVRLIVPVASGMGSATPFVPPAS
jgi:hypothetical protein